MKGADNRLITQADSYISAPGTVHSCNVHLSKTDGAWPSSRWNCNYILVLQTSLTAESTEFPCCRKHGIIIVWTWWGFVDPPMVGGYLFVGCKGPNENTPATCNHTKCATDRVIDNQTETLQFNEIPTQLLGEIKTDQLPFSDKK